MTNLRRLCGTLAASVLVLVGCGGGGGGSGSGGGPSDGGGANSGVAFPGFDFSLSPGTYWQFAWSYKYTSFVQGSGSSTKEDGGLLKITLGTAVPLQGIQAYPLVVTGDVKDIDGHSYAPRWTYLAIDSNRILGSTDGSTLQTIFDAATGKWTGGGFFADFGSTVNITGVSASISNEFTGTSGVALSRAAGQNFCDYIAGIEICSNDTAYTVRESDFVKGGIGPLGYDSYIGYASNGGGFSTSFTYTRDIGLVGTSLSATDGWTPKPIPWTQVSNMPQPRAGSAAVAVGTKIYVMGGLDASNTQTNTMFINDTATDTWSTGKPMPQTLAGPTAVTVNGRILVLGGGTSSVWEYNPATDAWATMPAASGAPSFTGPAAADAASGWITVFPDSVMSTEAYAYFYNPYNPSYNTQWYRSTSYIPNVDRGRGAASLNGKYYAFGGWCEPCNGYDSWLLELTMGAVGSPDTWTTNLPSLPTARLSMASAVANGCIYVIGGYNGAGLRDVERYDPNANTWTKKYELFKVRTSAAAASVNGKVYLIGGDDASVAPTTTVFVYDPAVDT